MVAVKMSSAIAGWDYSRQKGEESLQNNHSSEKLSETKKSHKQ